MCHVKQIQTENTILHSQGDEYKNQKYWDLYKMFFKNINY